MTTAQPGKRLPIISWQNSLLCAGKYSPKDHVKLALMTLAVRADNESLEFFMTQQNLADWTGKSIRSAKRVVGECLESGWLECTSKGNSSRASEYRLTFGESENPSGGIPGPRRGKGVTGDTIQTGDESAKGATGDTLNGAMRDTPTTPRTTPYKNSRSPEPTDRTGKPEGKEEETLPDDWEPNPTHLRSIEKIGGDPGEMVDEFRRRMTGENRTDWDRTFGEYINQSAQGREDVTFPHYEPGDDELHDDDAELPIAWVRPEWLTEAHERVGRVMAGHPADDAMCRALAAYLESCARLGREPSSLEFPQAVQRYVTAV